MKIFPLIVFILISFYAYPQKEDRNWVFGHDAGIDFNDLANPQIFKSNTSHSREIAASISDKEGNLLLYIGTPYIGTPSTFVSDDVYIMNGNHEVIDNSNINLDFSGAKGAFFIQSIHNSNVYYLFHSGYMVDSICPSINRWCNGLHVTEIDITRNNGKGGIIRKNVALLDNDIFEGIHAVKHANGIDWWVLAKESTSYSIPTNTFIKFLLTKNGIEGPFFQNLGLFYSNPSHAHYGGLIFSNNGNQLAFYNYYSGRLELFDFNRCNGILSKHRVLENDTSIVIYTCSFSPNDELLYVNHLYTENEIRSKLYQYELKDSLIRRLIWQDSIWSSIDSSYSLGQMQIGPNGKIYITYQFSFDGVFFSRLNPYNTYLGYIDKPNLEGLACNFKPLEFYLGDSSYNTVSLPNMPNYNLGPVVMDTCTSVGINETNIHTELKVYPNPVQNILHIEISSQKQQIENIQIIDINGRIIFNSYQSTINTSELSQGIYFYQVEMSDGELVRGKFVKE